MNKDKRHISFIDILGFRRALSLGKVDVAERKIIMLSDIIENTIADFQSIHAHVTTDFAYLWSEEEDQGWLLAIASILVFQRYFSFNSTEKITNIDESLMIRGGLAYGGARQFERVSKKFSHFLSLGDGLALAFETQATWPGMRFFVAQNATKYLKPLEVEGYESIPIKIERHHDSKGAITSREVCWSKPFEFADEHVSTAAKLFKLSLREFKHGKIDERIVLHYQQTLCSFLRDISDAKSLIPFLNFRHKQTKFHEYLAPVWSAAWLAMMQPRNSGLLPEIRDILYDKFLIITGSRCMGEVAVVLNRRNRWRCLVRFLRSGKLRFGGRDRKKSR